MLMGLINFLVQAPWPLVIIGVVILAYFASGKRLKQLLLLASVHFL